MEAEKHIYTLGIEEEFQIIDPETRELRSHIQEILAQGKMILKEQVKSEMHQSVVELGTEICQDVADARRQVVQLRRELATLAEKDGFNRLRRNASFFTLDGSADHGGRALRDDRERHAADRPRESDLRSPRSYRHS